MHWRPSAQRRIRGACPTPWTHGLAPESGGSGADDHGRRTEYEFSSKNRRENGLMRNQLAPPDPFFSPTGSTPMGSDNRPIDTPQLVVDRARLDETRLQAI